MLSLSHATALLVYHAYMSLSVIHCCSLCLPREYVCPCRTQLLSLSIAWICLSLSHAVALVYRAHMSVLVANSVRQGRSPIYWRKNSTFYTHVFLRTKHTQKESGEPNSKEAYKKVRKLHFLIRFFFRNECELSQNGHDGAI